VPGGHEDHHSPKPSAGDGATPTHSPDTGSGSDPSGSEPQDPKSSFGPGAGGMMGSGGMGSGGSRAGGMGGMMEQMGAPTPKELYPSLMSLPDLPLERRHEIQAQAGERMREGMSLLQKGFQDLTVANQNGRLQDMEDAITLIREGESQFGSGLAAKRALGEGKVPVNVALRWFKREMNLFPAETSDGARMFGLAPSSFHYAVIAILTSFCLVFVWMYFFKMRRAATLLERLAHAEAGTSTSGTASAANSARAAVSTTAGALVPRSATGDQRNTATRWKGKLQIVRIFEETANVKTFRLGDPNGSPVPFKYLPGQFLTLTVTPEAKAVRRSYTIASSPTQRDYVEITVKREEKGLVSRYLHDGLSEGDFVEIAAPSGKFTFTGGEDPRIVLIAGGVGITPMMSVMRYLTDRGWTGDIYLFYGCRTSEDLIFREEIEYRKRRHPNLRVVLAVSREQNLHGDAVHGRISAELIASHVPNLKSAKVHICGPDAMMSSMKQALLGLGLDSEQVKTETFGPTGRGSKPPTLPGPTADQGGENPNIALPVVAFARSGKSSALPPAKTILDVADEIGVEIDNSCREGTCGTCKVKLLAGEVTMEVDDGLDPEDRSQNMILACQAKSRHAVSVDA